LRVQRLDLNATLAEDPLKFSFLVFVYVILLEGTHSRLHRGWNSALTFAKLWPDRARDDLNVILKVYKLARVALEELISDLLTEDKDIFEHVKHSADISETILDLELGKHALLGILGLERLVEETLGEILKILAHKLVTGNQASEQVNDLVESLVDLVVVRTLEALLHLIISVGWI